MGQHIFAIKISIIAFPVYAFGYLMKDVLTKYIHPGIKLGIVIGIFALLTLFVRQSSIPIDLFNLKYGDSIFSFYPTTILVCSAVILLSQLINKYIKWPFIKDLSRGSMLIVALHYSIIHIAYSHIFTMPLSLWQISIFATLLLLVHYPIIKLTYHRLPILYGKWKK